MLTIFTQALAGDDMAQQQVLWLLGQPALWWFLIKWTVLITALVMLVRRLYRGGAHLGAALVLLAGIAAIWGTGLAVQNGAATIRAGLIDQTIALHSINLLTTALAIGVILWSISRLLKRAR